VVRDGVIVNCTRQDMEWDAKTISYSPCLVVVLYGNYGRMGNVTIR